MGPGQWGASWQVSGQVMAKWDSDILVILYSFVMVVIIMMKHLRATKRYRGTERLSVCIEFTLYNAGLKLFKDVALI